MAKKPAKKPDTLPTFTVDEDERGAVFLHWGNVSVKVAEELEGFDKFMEHMELIRKEINENYHPGFDRNEATQ